MTKKRRSNPQAAKPAGNTVKKLKAATKRRAATKPKEKKSYTTEENRGGHFFSAIKMWRILHEDGGRTIFNKQMLAERFFENLADEERPEPEALTAEIENELANDLEDDFDEGIVDKYGDDLDDGMLSMMAKRPGAATNSGKSPTPYKRIREKHKRYVQRKIEMLQKCNIGIEDTDELGNTLDEDALKQRKAANRSAERWYRYNPNGPWAEQFEELLNGYGVTGSDLLGMMALRDLLEDMRGTPHHTSLQQFLDRMMRCVPHKLRAEAIEQARAYRHSVGNTAKYVRKAKELERWYVAALQRQQVVIDYTTPGEPTRPRHLAALSTMFHREENSIYLLGSEKTATGWGPVKQWKCDRVIAVRATGLDNPRLAELHRDPLVRPAPGGGVERLDNNRVYDYSAGAWLEIGAKPTRLEVVVRVPAVGRPGSDETARASMLKAARRRAYGWMEWCREKPFHPRQVATLETTANGEKQLRLVVEKCYVAEMASRLLRLQDCFEVVEPRELTVAIRDYANAISGCHA